MHTHFLYLKTNKRVYVKNWYNDDLIIKWLESVDEVSGRTTLFSTDLHITGEALELSGGASTVNNIILGIMERDSILIAMEGEKTVLVVRTQASNQVTSVGEATLSDSVFGN